jgi:hypothetical protein
MEKKEANIKKKLPGAQTTIDVVCAPHPPSPAACTYSRPCCWAVRCWHPRCGR